VIDTLADTFPPLKTPDAARGNLPVRPASFVSREQKLETVRGLLRDDTVQLLARTGPGGIANRIAAALSLSQQGSRSVRLHDVC
jgi:hypothetical protein